MSRRRFHGLMACAAGLLLAVGSAPPGLAHEIAINGSTLAGPALAWVRTSVETEVVVLEHEQEITIHDRRYVLEMQTGSGVVVNQNGTVVTAASVVATDLEKAKLHAINSAFGAIHKVRIGDPFKRQRLRDAARDAMLRRCYGNSPHRECIVTRQTPIIEVFPWAEPPFAKGLTGQVLKAPKAAGVAVVQINGPTNMPSAALAPEGDMPDRLTILGFSGPPSGKTSPSETAVTPADLRAPKLTAGSGGRPVVDERGRVVGVVDVAAKGRASFHPAKEVAAALAAARIQAQRGVVDSTFEQAIRYYNSNHDTHAVERFQSVLDLYPKHVWAERLLEDSRKHAGTPQDRSGEMGGHVMPGNDAATSGPALSRWIIPGVLGLLVFTAAGVLLWRRRRARPSAAATTPPAQQPQSPAETSTATATPTETRTVEPVAAESKMAAEVPAETRIDAELPGRRKDTRPPEPAVPATPVAEPAGNGQSATEGRTAERPSASAAARLKAAETKTAGARASETRRERSGETRVLTGPPSADRSAFCTQCGKPSSPGHRFCGYCGNRFG
jgi:hypothetical protein